MSTFFKQISQNIKTELLDEFDKSFERKAFFDQPWQPRKREGRGSLLVVSGRLRRGLRGQATQNSIIFSHDAPYAALHNNGGKVKITPAMRRYFWAMYYKNIQGVAFNIKTREATRGSQRKNETATYWRNMALHKGKTITIPQRQFVGHHARIGTIVEDIVTKEMQEYVEKEINPIFNRLKYI